MEGGKGGRRGETVEEAKAVTERSGGITSCGWRRCSEY